MATRNDTSTTEQPPAVVECDIQEGQALARVDRGDVSVLVAAPADLDAAELEAALKDIPESVAWAADHFGGGASDE